MQLPRASFAGVSGGPAMLLLCTWTPAPSFPWQALPAGTCTPCPPCYLDHTSSPFFPGSSSASCSGAQMTVPLQRAVPDHVLKCPLWPATLALNRSLLEVQTIMSTDQKPWSLAGHPGFTRPPGDSDTCGDSENYAKVQLECLPEAHVLNACFPVWCC